jgi:hypothetical protein
VSESGKNLSSAPEKQGSEDQTNVKQIEEEKMQAEAPAEREQQPEVENNNSNDENKTPGKN